MMLPIVRGVPIMSCLSPCTLAFYLCQLFHPPRLLRPPGYLISDFFQPPRLLPPLLLFRTAEYTPKHKIFVLHAVLKG